MDPTYDILRILRVLRLEGPYESHDEGSGKDSSVCAVTGCLLSGSFALVLIQTASLPRRVSYRVPGTQQQQRLLAAWERDAEKGGRKRDFKRFQCETARQSMVNNTTQRRPYVLVQG